MSIHCIPPLLSIVFSSLSLWTEQRSHIYHSEGVTTRVEHRNPLAFEDSLLWSVCRSAKESADGSAGGSAFVAGVWGSTRASSGVMGPQASAKASCSYLTIESEWANDSRDLMWSTCHRTIRPSSSFTINETGPLFTNYSWKPCRVIIAKSTSQHLTSQLKLPGLGMIIMHTFLSCLILPHFTSQVWVQQI